MSADLLAELDSFYQKPQSQQQGQGQGQAQGAISQPQQEAPSDPFDFGAFSTSQAPQGSTQNQPPNNDGRGGFSAFSSQIPSAGAQVWPSQTSVRGDEEDVDGDDDGWGDFETADPAAATPTEAAPAQMPPKPVNTSPPPHPTRIVRASTFDLMNNNLVDLMGEAKPQEPSGSLLKSAVVTQAAQSKPPSQPQPQPQLSKQPKDPNVLFDAEDLDFDGTLDQEDEDDDDFGDFETGGGFSQPRLQPTETQAPQPQLHQPPSVSSPPSMDLLSLKDPPTTPPQQKKPGHHLSTLSISSAISAYPQAPVSPSFTERNPYPGLALRTPTSPNPLPLDKKDNAESPTPDTAWPAFSQSSSKNKAPSRAQAQVKANDRFKDDWSPFEDIPPEKTNKDKKPSAAKSKVKAKAGPSVDNDTWDWDAVDPPAQPKAAPPAAAPPSSGILSSDNVDDGTPPPTNIPPPSVLLSIFPQLLNLANTSLFKPLAGQPSAIKDRVASDPGTTDFLRALLLIATVAARVVAGRKLRWHRDKFLSQGMAISAAGAKGMKLAGVDRAQAAREDREAADVVAAWREQVGRLRSAVAAANAAAKQSQPQLKIPELGENMNVSTAKIVPTAPKACIVCGLKRDERLARVDFDVEDSFGEWWVEHWGHRACKNFWIEHEKQLRSR